MTNKTQQSIINRRLQANQSFGLHRFGARRECAQLLDIGLTKFQALSRRRDFPKPLDLGTQKRWALDEVWDWAKTQCKKRRQL